MVLPSSTGGERISFSVAGIDLNLRFSVYAGAAAVMTLALLPLMVREIRSDRWSLVAPAMFLGWMLVTTLLAGQPPLEWLPTVVRWVLYLAVLLFARAVGRLGLFNQARDQVRIAIGLGLVGPLVFGAWELLSGTAPILNNAPRISSLTFGHPVAFSLILLLGTLVVMPVALRVSRAPRPLEAIAAAMVIAALVEIMFSYTRLNLVLLLVGIVAIVVAVQPGRRLRAAAASGAMAALVLTIATPLLISRFEQPVHWPPPATPGSSGDANPSPIAGASSSAPTPAPTPTATPRLVVIDNSTQLRIEIHQRGLGYIAASPLVGHGPGSFDRLFQADTGRAGVAAHDDLLLVAVEMGLPGLALLLVLYGSVVMPLFPALADGRATGGFAVSALVAFGLLNLAAVIHNPTYFPEVQVAAWTLVGLAGATAPPVRSWLPQRLRHGFALTGGPSEGQGG